MIDTKCAECFHHKVCGLDTCAEDGCGFFAQRVAADDDDAGFYDKEETFGNCTVQVLTNTKTGACSVGWWKNGEN